MIHQIAVPLSDFQPAKGTVLTIGSFDGVHLGHQHILKQVKKVAEDHQLLSVLMTFWPHPRMVIQDYQRDFRLLTTNEEKAEALAQQGIDHMVIAPFTREFSEQSPEEYVQHVLIDHLSAQHIIVGYDHRFGKNRAGDFDFLQDMGKAHGFEVTQISPYQEEQIAVSSTKIRDFLSTGEVAKAKQLLGRPYSLTGLVVQGDQRGRKIGFPTANISVSEEYKLIPKTGVYAVKVRVGEVVFKGMMNIGNRPTFHTMPQEKSLEAHLFDFEGNLYGQRIQVEVIARLRDEQAFNGPDELVEQLKKDQERALNYLS